MTLPVGARMSAGTPASGLRVVTQLGVRFWDYAFAQPITHGLYVAAWALDLESPPTIAVRGPSGVMSFHGLPGTRALEYPRDGVRSSVLASPPTPLRFVITVADVLRRFVPTAFTVEVPFVAPVMSPPYDPAGPPMPLFDAYLFSATTRPVSIGMTAIRADLWDHDADVPASNAVLRVQVGDRRGIGVADADGKVLALLTSPLVERLRLGSPPGAGQSGPDEQTWPATVEASYWPSLTLPMGDEAVLPSPWTSLPSLKLILEGQSTSSIFADAASPPSPAWHGDVSFGRELVLRTAPGSSLWISRGSSPP